MLVISVGTATYYYRLVDLQTKHVARLLTAQWPTNRMLTNSKGMNYKKNNYIRFFGVSFPTYVLW